ncbi:transglycosylase family protein [Streptomyces sp. CA-100214]
MLSGNGRHRRPRQAPALVVAAGVTGSAIAIPLLGATGAHAAGVNWDQVAECETGGAWSQNAGNGYYGGLQLPQEAWERYGGLEYAASADQASRSQQIRIAEKLYADQGIAAWPTCGLLAGLGNPRAPPRRPVTARRRVHRPRRRRTPRPRRVQDARADGFAQGVGLARVVRIIRVVRHVVAVGFEEGDRADSRRVRFVPFVVFSVLRVGLL